MLNILFLFDNIKKTSPFTTMILKSTFLQQREASALTIRTEKMPIKKVKMEDKRKHHHFLSLGIGDAQRPKCTGCQLFEKFIRRSSQIRVVDCSPKYYFFVYCSVLVCMFVKTFLEIQMMTPETFFLFCREHWGRIFSVHSPQGGTDLMVERTIKRKYNHICSDTKTIYRFPPRWDQSDGCN